MSLECYCCGNTALDKIVYQNPEFHGEIGAEIFNDRDLYHCPECKFSFSHPFMEDEKLSEFYIHFYRRRMRPLEIIKRHMDDQSLSLSPGHVSQVMLALFYGNFPNRFNVLDVGAGEGGTFDCLRALGFDPVCYAAESEVDYLKKIYQLKNIQYVPETSPYLDRKDDTFNEHFDFILSSHTLEHFNADHIGKVLLNVRKLLKPDGVFVCEVPKADFSGFVGKSKLNEGCHLSFFTKEALRNLFGRYGYQILFIAEFGPAPRYFEETQDQAYCRLQATAHRAPKGLLKRSLSSVKNNIPFMNQAYEKLKKLKWNLKKIEPRRAVDVLKSPLFQSSKSGSLVRVCVRKESVTDVS